MTIFQEFQTQDIEGSEPAAVSSANQGNSASHSVFSTTSRHRFSTLPQIPSHSGKGKWSRNHLLAHCILGILRSTARYASNHVLLEGT